MKPRTATTEILVSDDIVIASLRGPLRVPTHLGKETLSRLLPTGFSVSIHQFAAKFVNDCDLKKEAAASAIRDGIGRGLKRISDCADTPDCGCAYCTYFKPHTPCGFAGSLSPGFILEALGFRNRMPAGHTARLRLLLPGSAGEAFAWFAAALMHCGQVGIGYPEARFTIGTCRPPHEVTADHVFRSAEQLSGANGCRIVFKSPFILSEDGQRIEEPGFPRVVKAIVERLQPNIGFWCGGWLRNKQRDMIAEPLLTLASQLEWEFVPGHRVYEVARKHDGRVESLLGFTGELLVRGNIEPFWPLLLAGSLVHIGEAPHLDRGRYEVQPILKDGAS